MESPRAACSMMLQSSPAPAARRQRGPSPRVGSAGSWVWLPHRGPAAAHFPPGSTWCSYAASARIFGASVTLHAVSSSPPSPKCPLGPPARRSPHPQPHVPSVCSGRPPEDPNLHPVPPQPGSPLLRTGSSPQQIPLHPTSADPVQKENSPRESCNPEQPLHLTADTHPPLTPTLS